MQASMSPSWQIIMKFVGFELYGRNFNVAFELLEGLKINGVE